MNAKRKPNAGAVWLAPIAIAGIALLMALAAARLAKRGAPASPEAVAAVAATTAPTYAALAPQLAATPSQAPVPRVAAAPFRPLTSGLPQPPLVTASGYLLVDIDTGETLAEKNATSRAPIASLTKIATALAALSLVSKDAMVEISPHAAAEPPNRMGLVAGDRLSVEELLYGLLLDSGNDAAAALADAVGGADRLVARMNAIAGEIGLQDTHFSNLAGYDSVDNYSTAREIAMLGRYALRDDPLFGQIVATVSKVLPSGPEHGWYGPANLNRLLAEYQGTFGVKTGYTEDSGYTLMGAAARNGRRLLVVVLGATKHFSDGAALLDYGFGIYAARPAPRG